MPVAADSEVQVDDARVGEKADAGGYDGAPGQGAGGAEGALNLTTIDWRHADADVRRILDGATGEFYNDYAKRAQPFIEVLKQAEATTLGSITEAGLESETADTAQTLVAVSVQTSAAGESGQTPRAWQMRISVQWVGGQVKVSNVGFVP